MAFGKAPRIAIAGNSAGTKHPAPCNEKLQVEFPFLDDAIALRAIDMFVEYSLFVPAPPEAFGRIFARMVSLASSFKERAHTLGSLEKKNGLARGIFNRLVADDRCPASRLDPLLPSSGWSAYKVVFRSNSADMYGRGNDGEDLLWAQDTSPSGQFAQLRKLCIMAREGAWGEMANSKLRPLMAYNK